MERVTRDTSADVNETGSAETTRRFTRPEDEAAGQSRRADYHGGFGAHSDADESQVGTFATGADQDPDPPQEDPVGDFATGNDPVHSEADEQVGGFATGAGHPPLTPPEKADRRFSEGRDGPLR